MRTFTVVLVCFLALGGCVSNKVIETVQPGDYELDCAQLQRELGALGVKFKEAQGDSGVTGKNVALAILFWPGIFLNENQARRNRESVNGRIKHLNNIYAEKCVSQNPE